MKWTYIIPIIFALLIFSGCAQPEPTPPPTPAPAPEPASAPPPTPSPTPAPTPTLSYSEICSELSKLCPELALDLERLPEIKDGVSEQDLEVLNDIYSLYSEAKNPEVKEAFDLIVEGGTPDPSDFQYEVPNWNTELQVLCWLAEQNEFMEDDTLAQAIAIANGLWVTMGDDEVREAVYGDANDLLNFFRETSELQKARGFHCLEDYPLEAKVCLAWTGNQSPLMCLRNLLVSLDQRFDRIFDLKSYEWNTLSIDTVKQIRQIMDEKGWVDKDVEKTIENIEKYFFFTNYHAGNSDHWIYLRGTPDTRNIVVEGESVRASWFGNADFLFQHYQETGKGIGSCIDMATVVDSWAKSWGIATTFISRISDGGPYHTFVVFHEPESNRWKPYEEEVNFLTGGSIQDLYLFRPPLYQNNYLKSTEDIGHYFNHATLVSNYPNVFIPIKEDIKQLDAQIFLREQFNTSLLKQWLFSIPDFLKPNARKFYTFEEIVPLLNTPDKVSIFMGNNIKYQSEEFNEYVPAKTVFERGYDDCDGHATIQAYFLKANGYEAWNVCIGCHDPIWWKVGHSICVYLDNGLYWILDNCGVKKGPFKSLDELGDSVISGTTITLFDPFDITSRITGDPFQLPHTVYRK